MDWGVDCVDRVGEVELKGIGVRHWMSHVSGGKDSWALLCIVLGGPSHFDLMYSVYDILITGNVFEFNRVGSW